MADKKTIGWGDRCQKYDYTLTLTDQGVLCSRCIALVYRQK